MDLNNKSNNSDIFNSTMLLHTSVVAEKQHKFCISSPQYHNCQTYHHTKAYCLHKPRCVKYTEKDLFEKS